MREDNIKIDAKETGLEGVDTYHATRDRVGTGYHSWLWHYTKRRKVAGSIPDEITGIFN
jgi:hypothetical protein